jgi:hypothetical protein
MFESNVQVQGNAQLDCRKTPLTPKETIEVEKVLKDRTNRVVVDKYNIEMSTEHIKCLKKGVWLNDEVMNFYMCLLQVLHVYFVYIATFTYRICFASMLRAGVLLYCMLVGRMLGAPYHISCNINIPYHTKRNISVFWLLIPSHSTGAR